ncbi:MAG: MYG1 family protein [bacterium]
MSYLKNFTMEKMNKLITHNGSFHADDVFACATLCLYLEKNNEKFEIIRTRDEHIIKTGDYIFDIGGIYDESKNLFDHHQIGGAGRRKNNIEYAAFGLVWKKFGKILTGSEELSDFIDNRLSAPVDAFDNGFDLVENKYETTPYYIQHFLISMRPTWREEEENLNTSDLAYRDQTKSKDGMFLKSVEIAKIILSREIIQVQHALLAEESVVSIYNKTEDKRIIVLDKNYPSEYILNNFSEPVFIIYPRVSDNTWGAKAVNENPKTFINRKNFPKLWAGLKNEELANVTGVADAIFCHRGLFLTVAKSKEGAIQLAQLALSS